MVETTGMAPETWATESGYPHSVDARVTERFQRKSKNDLTLTMTMDDSKLYTRPVSLGVVHFRWIPSQTFFDFSASRRRCSGIEGGRSGRQARWAR